MAAGKSSEYDYVYDPANHRVTWTDRGVMRRTSPGSGRSARMPGRPTTARSRPCRPAAAYGARQLRDGARRQCHGLMPDRPDFHAPMAHTPELPSIYRPRSEGGVLEKPDALDVFNCLRRPDEASFAGGVYVVVEWADAKTGALFRGKGIPVWPQRPLRPRLQSLASARRRGAHHDHGGGASRPFRRRRTLPA